MFRPRLIATLLLKDGAVVKSVRFAGHSYIGDPLNAVRLLNGFGADELLVLDIAAYRERRTIDRSLLRDIAEEAMMPFGVGGGVRELVQIEQLVSGGCEKVVIGSHAVADPSFVQRAAAEFGSSTISVCIDVKTALFGGKKVWTQNGTRNSGLDPVRQAQAAEAAGAGEIILQSIDRDGTMAGYDLRLIREVSDGVGIPVVALGGAGKLDHFKQAFAEGGASAAAAGSAFVYLKRRGAVLINYPERGERPF